MESNQGNLRSIVIKTTIVHTVSYMIMGMIAAFLLDYAAGFSEPPMDVFMHPIDSLRVMAGPLFQPIRGLLFGIVFYLLRDRLFGKSDGWLVMWVMLVIVGVISTFGPTPGSIEGMIYTTIPFADHFPGWLEVMTQALLFAFGTFYWVRNPEKTWLKWVLGILFVLSLLLPAMGLIFGQMA